MVRHQDESRQHALALLQRTGDLLAHDLAHVSVAEERHPFRERAGDIVVCGADIDVLPFHAFSLVMGEGISSCLLLALRWDGFGTEVPKYRWGASWVATGWCFGDFSPETAQGILVDIREGLPSREHFHNSPQSVEEIPPPASNTKRLRRDSFNA